MKKLISLILAIALVLSLGACAAKEPTAEPDTDEPGKTDAKTPADYSDRKDKTGEDGKLWTNSSGGTGESDDGGWAMDGMPAEPEPEPEPDGAYGGDMKTSAAEAPSAPVAPGAAEPSGTPDPGSVGIIDDPAPTPEYGDEEPVMPGDDWEVEPIDPVYPGDPDEPWEPIEIEGEAFVLTASEWNDNDNWPFFTNLVNSGRITFPVYGLDPTHRIKVTVNGGAYAGVELLDAKGSVIWKTEAGKDGVAYLFYKEGEEPASVRVGGEIYSLMTEAEPDPGDQQGTPVMKPSDELTVDASGEERAALQVMFIVDTTGSMGDEMAFLQKDFSSIAGAVQADGTEYSVCFYRDEGDDYVTKVTEFTTDVSAVQKMLENEYATGGGDTPEAVAQILTETLSSDFASGHNGWRDDAVKVAFMIFDAPPHDGTDKEISAAVRKAAEMGIHLVPVICSNGDRETELFGRAIAILTNGTYVFLTDDSGVGLSHLEPIVGSCEVEKLHDIIVRIINEYRP